MRDPEDEHVDETDHPARIAGTLSERVPALRVAGVGVLWHLELEHEQRDHDGEHPVGERFHPVFLGLAAHKRLRMVCFPGVSAQLPEPVVTTVARRADRAAAR